MAIQATFPSRQPPPGCFTKSMRLGGVDILINNAGIDGARALAWKADIDAWRQVIEINLFGAFLLRREALQRMVPQRKGVILSMSSSTRRSPGRATAPTPQARRRSA